MFDRQMVLLIQNVTCSISENEAQQEMCSCMRTEWIDFTDRLHCTEQQILKELTGGEQVGQIQVFFSILWTRL